MVENGEEIFITGLETAILFEIGKDNSLVKNEEVINILQTLINKLQKKGVGEKNDK